jgi:hypothetical protein
MMMSVAAVMMVPMPPMAMAIAPDVQMDARTVVAAVVAAANTIAIPGMAMAMTAAAMTTMRQLDCVFCVGLLLCQRGCVDACGRRNRERCTDGCDG